MNHLRKRRFWLIGSVLGYAVLALALGVVRNAAASRAAPSPGAVGVAAFSEPATSSPIALSADKNQLWVVNPDDDSVSVIDVSSPSPAGYQLLRKIRVGQEPRAVALDTITATSYNAYVANAASNSVTVINVSTSGTFSAVVEKELTTGAEPWSVVASPDGKRVFVANSGQDTLTVIRTDTRSIVGSVNLRTSACNVGDQNRHFQPRGLAVTLDSSKLYVARFLSFTGGATPKQASDTGKVGVICRADLPAAVTSLPASFTPITLAPRVTGFKIDTNGDGTPDTDTSAYPNQMQSIVIRGGRAFVPNIAASPAGPLKFNVDTQAFLNMVGGVNGASQSDLGALNLHLGARQPEPGKTKLFFANPWAVAFTSQSGAGAAYVVAAGSDLLVKLNVGADDAPAFTVDADTTRYIDLHDPTNGPTSGANAGKNPLGIAIRNNGPGNNFAYVMNYISRNVSVVNLDTDSVARVIPTTALPLAGTQDEQLHVGKEVFFASRGVFDGGKTNRLSADGWQNCASCHFDGLTDGNIWSFNAGPRKAVPLNGTWSPHNPDDQRVLNYSAIVDELQDFETNIRNVSGPGNLPAPAPPNTLDPNHGLLIGDDGDIDKAPGVLNAFAKPNAGRPQLTVTLPGSSTAWPALDAMKEWVRFAVRTPNRPLTSAELAAAGSSTTGGLNLSAVQQGRRLFFRAGCQTCHGGTKWTISTRDFDPPPDPATIATETTPPAPGGVDPVGAQYLFGKLKNIGSFNFRAGGIGGVEKATDGKDALGKDHNLDGKGDGYNIPSLLGIWAVQPYYHNGGCETLACVLTDSTHRNAGRRAGRPDLSASEQAQVVEFLKSIDAQTVFPSNLYVDDHDIFFDPPKVIRGTQATVGVNVSLFGTRADLTDLLGGGALTVRFRGPGLDATVPLNVADFSQDFGQARVTTTWNVPNAAGPALITVQVDSGDAAQEADERDNTAARRIVISPPPPDKTPPTVTPGSVRISDDSPFNANDAIVTTRNVKVRFQAADAGGSGLDSFCIVRYSYDTRLRRWVEENCTFKRLPAPDPGSAFTVDAKLPVKAGTVYAFVWVKDRDGNISRQPELDVASFIPAGSIEMERNDVRLFRITLSAGQSLTLRFAPSDGDVDVSAFANLAGPTRCAVSAQNGTAEELVTLGAGGCTGTSFQVEVRAVVNSRFTIGVEAGAAASLSAAPDAVAPGKDVPSEPLVAGPPARQAAIESGSEVLVPLARR
jgi:YVTN family beta-propeller protein